MPVNLEKFISAELTEPILDFTAQNTKQIETKIGRQVLVIYIRRIRFFFLFQEM